MEYRIRQKVRDKERKDKDAQLKADYAAYSAPSKAVSTICRASDAISLVRVHLSYGQEERALDAMRQGWLAIEAAARANWSTSGKSDEVVKQLDEFQSKAHTLICKMAADQLAAVMVASAKDPTLAAAYLLELDQHYRNELGRRRTLSPSDVSKDPSITPGQFVGAVSAAWVQCHKSGSITKPAKRVAISWLDLALRDSKNSSNATGVKAALADLRPTATSGPAGQVDQSSKHR